MMPSNHLIQCHPFLLLPSISPSIRVFSYESVLCIRWPKYWSFSFSISPSNECLLNFFPILSILVCWCINLFTVSLITLSFFARLVVMSPCSFVSFFLLIQPSYRSVNFVGFPKNELLISVILSTVLHFISFVSAWIFIVSFLLLALGLVCSSFSSSLKSEVRLLTWCSSLFLT